jgi:hypothetical protein
VREALQVLRHTHTGLILTEPVQLAELSLFRPQDHLVPNPPQSLNPMEPLLRSHHRNPPSHCYFRRSVLLRSGFENFLHFCISISPCFDSTTALASHAWSYPVRSALFCFYFLISHQSREELHVDSHLTSSPGVEENPDNNVYISRLYDHERNGCVAELSFVSKQNSMQPLPEDSICKLVLNCVVCETCGEWSGREYFVKVSA